MNSAPPVVREEEENISASLRVVAEHAAQPSMDRSDSTERDEAMLPPPLKRRMLSRAANPESSLQEGSLERFYEALELVPASEKEAYTEALERAPSLVETESDPMRFLLCNDFNTKEAVSRFVGYWEKRKSLFGSRAFLPMNQTGEGALTFEDLAVLNTGFLALLAKDSQGRVVLCTDKSRLQKAIFVDASRLRCLFYMFSVACEDKASQTAGVVLFRIINTPSFRLNIQSMLDLAETVPIRFAQVVALCVPERAAKRMFSHTIVPAMNKAMNEAYKSRFSVHVGDSPQDLVDKAHKAGFSKQGLPVSVGGLWNSEEFTAWQKDRRDLEKMVNHCKPPPSPKVPPEGSATTNKSDMSLDLHGTATKGTLEHHVPKVAQVTLAPASVSTIPPPPELGEQVSAGSAATACSKESTRSNAARAATERDRDEILTAVDRLSCDDKAAYLDARERVPDLVEKESDPNVFLDCESFNVDKAAQRLVAYWSKRKQIFGARAFLPMTQTGEGALNRGDLNVLASCYFAQLPNDRAGRTVLCYDGSKLNKCSQDSRLRVAFYLFSVAAESEGDGCVVICIKDSKKQGKGSDRDKKDRLGSMIAVLPRHVKALHLVEWSTKGAPTDAGQKRRKTSLKKTVSTVHQLFGDSVVRKTYIYPTSSKEDIAEKLSKFGLSREGLPKSLGGEWGYAKLTQWQELRTRLEWGLPAGSAGKDECLGLDFASVKPLWELTDDEKTERKRRMNVIHSRRKRERERIEIEVLQEQCQDLGDRNEALTIENLQFEGILIEAESNAARMDHRPSVAGSSRGLCAPPMSSDRAGQAFAAVDQSLMETIAPSMNDVQSSHPEPSALDRLYAEQSVRDRNAEESQTHELQLSFELQRFLQQHRSFRGLGGVSFTPAQQPMQQSLSSNVPTHEPLQQSVLLNQIMLRQEMERNLHLQQQQPHQLYPQQLRAMTNMDLERFAQQLQQQQQSRQSNDI